MTNLQDFRLEKSIFASWGMSVLFRLRLVGLICVMCKCVCWFSIWVDRACIYVICVCCVSILVVVFVFVWFIYEMINFALFLNIYCDCAYKDCFFLGICSWLGYALHDYFSIEFTKIWWHCMLRIIWYFVYINDPIYTNN